MKTSGSLPRLGLLAATLLLAATSSAYDFIINDKNPPPNGTGLPIKWPAGPIRLRLLLGDTANLSDGSSYNQSARTAAQTWNALLGSIQFTTEFRSGNPLDNNDVNELGFAANIYGKDFEENTLAVTTGYSLGNERVESDIIFNTKYTWDSYRGPRRPGVIDLQRVALHELGHVLGLDHPDEAGQTVDAIMNSRVGDRYELSPDDIEGGQSLYGPPGVPANDNFANATVINLTSGNLTLKGYNTNATKEPGDPRQGDNPGGRSVWWRWTAPSAGSMVIDTKGSYFDTTLGIYTGSTLANLVKITDSDDIQPGVVQASTVSFNVSAGTLYRIAVDGFNNIEQNPRDTSGADNGGITLNLAFTSTGPSIPTITTQPASATVTAGGSVSFSVVATGGESLTYQWTFNGTPIPGATAATYTINNVATSNAGNYAVTITNAAGSVTSNTATLTVNPAVVTPPPSGGGKGGGGGGAPGLWFLGALALLLAARTLARHAKA